MRWMELQNVEFGECIVLGGAKREILMVDCGSSNNIIRDGNVGFDEYVKNGIMRRYRGMDRRAFLLTHCHRDHVCGLWTILGVSPLYFNRLYLPVSPCDEKGDPLLLEFALFVYAFLDRLTGYSRVNVCELELFGRAAKAAGAEAVFPIAQGSGFVFDGAEYEVLWPARTGFPFPALFASAVEELNVRLSSPFLPACAGEFLRLKRAFCTAYRQACAVSPLTDEGVAELRAAFGRVSALLPSLRLLPCAGEIAALLENPVTQTAYSDTVNAASVIFQNVRRQEASADDLLMTGDAPPESIEAVAERLYDAYYAVKVPHHGTASFVSPILNGIAASHLLISNGEYRQGGQIAQEYAALAAVKHCTSPDACPWYKLNGACCNRLAACWEHSGGPSLTVRCPVYLRREKAFPCSIAVVSPSGRRACFCEAGSALPPEEERRTGIS